MGARQSDTLVFPPFPVLAWDGSSWTCSDNLPACGEFHRGMGSDFVNLHVATDEDERSPPTPEQVAAYEFLKANDGSIARNICGRIHREYPFLRDRFTEYCGADELDEILPQISGPEDLKAMIGVVNVYIQRNSRAGVAYVGLEMDCTWDEEHGLGVMLHEDRIWDYGAAEILFMD